MNIMYASSSQHAPQHVGMGNIANPVSWRTDLLLLYMQIAQLTYPVLLARYEAILVTYSQHIQRNTEGKDRLQLDETLCVLEVCSAMKIAPAVADAAPQTSSQQQVLPQGSLIVRAHISAWLRISFLQHA